MDTSLLEEAMETGEILTVIYHGGSYPGVPRQIAPISFARHLVLARCYWAERIKFFRIDQLELAPPGAEPVKQERKPAPPRFENIRALVVALYEQWGEHDLWIDAEDDYLAMYQLRSDVKRKKDPVLTLTYRPHHDDELSIVTDEEIKVSKIPRVRPWEVRMRSSKWTFTQFDKAAARFLEKVETIKNRGKQ